MTVMVTMVVGLGLAGRNDGSSGYQAPRSTRLALPFHPTMSDHIEPIRISYQALQNNAPTVRTDLEKALGSQDGSLGFVLIDGKAA